MHSRRFFVGLIIFGLTPSGASGQERATLLLTITSRESGVAIPDATARFPSKGLSALSDAEGRARITDIPPGPHLLIVEHIGHRTEQRIVPFDPGQTVHATIELVIEPVPLHSVRVEVPGRHPRLDRVGFYDRERLGFGTFLEREEIVDRALGSMRLSNVFRGIRGVQVKLLPGSGALVPVSTRSFGASLGQSVCIMPIYLDGIYIDTERHFDLDRFIPTSDIEAIEVFAGPSETPIQYSGTNRECGVILMWTRTGQ